MNTIMDYFNDEIEYPQDVALEPLPINTLWSYISSTFLNGFINYVKPIKVFVLDRYKDDKTEEIKNLKPQPHTNLHHFGDDVIILAEIENHEGGVKMYMLFWFDCDVSDCRIGRFETSDFSTVVIQSLVNWLDEMKKENEGRVFSQDYDNGVLNYHEVPLTWLSGWLSF